MQVLMFFEIKNHCGHHFGLTHGYRTGRLCNYSPYILTLCCGVLLDASIFVAFVKDGAA
jgi:hypothetical protein